MHAVVPGGGTSLVNALAASSTLTPAPDNITLLTDGLPTMGRTRSRSGTVSARERLKLFDRAIRDRPAGVPVNILLFPMEGDPMAASSFWKLAMTSNGSFMSLSEDWP